MLSNTVSTKDFSFDQILAEVDEARGEMSIIKCEETEMGLSSHWSVKIIILLHEEAHG